MKLDIKTRHERTGMLRKTDHYIVDVTVHFTEEEKQLLRQHKDEEMIILERDPPHSAKGDGPSKVPGANSLIGRMVMGSNDYNLRVKNLLKGTDSYDLPSPLDAREYQEEVIEKMKKLKNYLSGQGMGTAADTSIEL